MMEASFTTMEGGRKTNGGKESNGREGRNLRKELVKLGGTAIFLERFLE
jgi:hypothetical protein